MFGLRSRFQPAVARSLFEAQNRQICVARDTISGMSNSKAILKPFHANPASLVIQQQQMSLQLLGVRTFASRGRDGFNYSRQKQRDLYPECGQRKHKIPQKRASALLTKIKADHKARKVRRKELPDFKVGDAIQVTMLLSKTWKKRQRVRGVVMGRFNNGMMSSFLVRNIIGGIAVEKRIPLYSPMLESIQVLQEAFIHKGRKRVRRNKIYYMRDRPDSQTTVLPESKMNKKEANKKKKASKKQKSK